MSEKTIMQEVQLALARMGYKVFRNNSGYLRDIRGQYVHFGLCTGSADLIGIVPPSGRFLAIEIKTDKGVATKEQIAFLKMVNDCGGIGFIARSVEEAIQNLKERL